MTKVMTNIRVEMALHFLLCLMLLCAAAIAQDVTAAQKPAQSLYLELSSVGLDPGRVYHVRDYSLDRAALHITLNDGIIAFTQDVAGQVTGAFFEGDGEILASPPNRTERASMSLFTGGAILEESFITAFFRFNDNTFTDMQRELKPTSDPQGFITQWDATARSLADADALRLFLTFAQFLPSTDTPDLATLSIPAHVGDSFLHLRIRGRKLGTFDAIYDSQSPEQVRIGQLRTVENESYYDTWTSFPVGSAGKSPDDFTSDTGNGAGGDPIQIDKYKIHTEITPPTELKAEAWLHLQVHDGGERTLLFELSRFLQLDHVEANEHAVEFIQNPPPDGTQRARRENDLVAVVFPQPLSAAQQLDLHFVYHGNVLSDAGGGLLYVGARGTWYPNRGLGMANYELEFSTPSGWTLVATGRKLDDLTASEGQPGKQVSHWVSERAIPVAGFNLGRYSRAEAHAGNIKVEVYAALGVEKSFPKAAPDIAVPPSSLVPLGHQPSIVIRPAPPSPRRTAQPVADTAAEAITFFSPRFGPYPYGSLFLAQMPGALSQGWPGLVYLSSYSFLTNEERGALQMASVDRTISSYVLVHEIAHQWWGDTVSWAGYRDQWIMEALANYSAFMLLQSKDPQQFRAVMEQYRKNLSQKNSQGARTMDDGPVTLGLRLSNSHFPNGYESISYGRGTWLFHMLRCMMRDAELSDRGTANRSAGQTLAQADEPFNRALRRLRDNYEGKAVTTGELLHVFEQEMPPSLQYDGHKSLDWFYQSWVNGTSVPHLSLQAVKFSDQPGATNVTGAILQEDSPEDMVTSVPIYAVNGKKNVFLGRVFADGPETQFHLKAPAGTRRVVLDPEHTVLAETN